MFEIGNSLREARMRQGLGYGEAELATKIRAKYIRALEEEDFDVLPSGTYARGFLRVYADYLGLDGQLYVDEFGSRFGQTWRDEIPQQPASRRRRQARVERRGVVLALVGIAAVVVLVFVAWKFGGVDASTTTPSVVRPSGAAQPELVLRGVGSGAYVEARRDGRVVLQATIPGGAIERLGGSKFSLYIRRSGNLRVSIGGRPVSLPARKTLAVEVGLDRTTQLGG